MFVINHLFAFATAAVSLAIIYCVIRMCRPYETYMTKGIQRGFVVTGIVLFLALQWLAVALNLSKGLY